ncbi:predicted protein [Chaetoceros tenuissimus]|uniref:Uncharacterized protein n=1 Tax=Chaetoceros tenuissimus TaxID=426638 RepID=A0AAD3H304_9STRA|nr:predicted protein [Chaetoceros tenuissimus]
MSKQQTLKTLWSAPSVPKRQRVEQSLLPNQASLDVGTLFGHQASLGVQTRLSNRSIFRSQELEATTSWNQGSLGDIELSNIVFGDCAVVQLRDDDLQAGNLNSPKLNKFLWYEHIDSSNEKFFKFSKSVKSLKPGTKGFVGKPFGEHRLELNPESRSLTDFCDLNNIVMRPPFVKVYTPSLREEGSTKSGYMKSHRDKLIAHYCNGIEPFVRVMITRISGKVDETDDTLYKNFEWIRRIEGSSEYDRVSLGMEDGDVLFMGPTASGKLSNIQHQPMIQERNSISFMYDLVLQPGSKFKGWTIPQFADYVVDCGVFVGKDYHNVRYGK